MLSGVSLESVRPVMISPASVFSTEWSQVAEVVSYKVDDAVLKARVSAWSQRIAVFSISAAVHQRIYSQRGDT